MPNTPLFEEFMELAMIHNQAFHKRATESISVGMIPEVLLPFFNMKNNLGPERFKAFDMAFREADNENQKIIEIMTGGITKKMWGIAFWGWERKPEVAK